MEKEKKSKKSWLIENKEFFREIDTIEIDPLVRLLNHRKVKQEISEFRDLLDSKCTENRLHDFLASHSYFFNGIIRLYGVSPLYSKIRLSDTYEVDFAGFDSTSVGPEWFLIELESPKKNLLTKSGEFSSTANHAMQQVRDWQNWIHENTKLASELMSNISYPRGYVFVGRRTELNPQAMKRIKRLNHDNRFLIEIHSLDWFISAASSCLNLLDGDKFGNWVLPMQALSHKELKKGLPKFSQEYIDNFMKGYSILYPQEILNDRNYHDEMIDDKNYI